MKKLHWLPIECRIKFKILLMTYKILNSVAPSYLRNVLNPYEPVRTMRSSNSNLLVAPKPHLRSCGDRAFSYAAPLLWNSLLSKVKAADSVKSFKVALKTHLFKMAYFD